MRPSFCLVFFLFCLWAAPAQASISGEALEIAGRLRTFELSTSFTVPKAIIVALHPRPASGADMRFISGLDREGLIVAYPDGDGGGWRAAPNDPTDDIDFLEALVSRVRRSLNLPDTPVYVVGVSNGAAMAERLIQARPNLFSGAALVSGAADLPVRHDRAIAPDTLVVIGAGDPDRERLEAAAARRRAGNGCRQADRLSPHPLAELTAYGCSGGVLHEWRVRAGHVWPGARDSGPLSWPDAPLDATHAILDFFDLLPPEPRSPRPALRP